MRYDPEKPIAVFLGPSLRQEMARSVLDANYYPPVRMGDVYRLLATGVRSIAIIDGVFHETTPVWQRELVAALEGGIHVVGGASMGALRAAEVAFYGMVGVGIIYEWYRDEIIDGDDEVALLHADESQGYRALSEPLVNMRFNLERAERRGLIRVQERECLIAVAKEQFFGERAWGSLFQSEAFARLSSSAREGLAAFIRHESVDLKREDALAVLEHCARHSPPSACASRAPRWSFPGMRRPFLQSALGPGGELVSGEQILLEALRDSDWAASQTEEAKRTFFLRQWVEERGIAPDAAFRERFEREWRRTACGRDEEGWLHANGITTAELQEVLNERAAVAWVEARGPSAFGLDFTPHRRCLEAYLGAHPEGPVLREHFEGKAAKGCFLAAWARDHGVSPPPEVEDEFLAAWEHEEGIGPRQAWLDRVGLTEQDYRRVWGEQALGRWLVAQGPAHFGYPTWSLEQALLRELQLAGRAASLAAAIGARSRSLEAEGGVA